jgi:hypothetical protein
MPIVKNRNPQRSGAMGPMNTTTTFAADSLEYTQLPTILPQDRGAGETTSTTYEMVEGSPSQYIVLCSMQA